MYGARLLSGAGPAQYGDGLQGLSLLRVGGDEGEVGFPHCGLLFSQEQQSSTTQTSFVSLLLFFFMQNDCLYHIIKPNRSSNIKNFPVSRHML